MLREAGWRRRGAGIKGSRRRADREGAGVARRPGRPKLVLGVYVVTAAGMVPGRGHAEVAIGAIEGGANAVQLRAPGPRDEELLPLARGAGRPLRRAGRAVHRRDRKSTRLN